MNADGTLGGQVTPAGVRAVWPSPDSQLCAGIAEGHIRSYPIAGGGNSGGRAITAAKPDESIIRWGAKGIFTSSYEGGDGWIDRVDTASGGRSRVYSFSLQEPGAAFSDPPALAPDGSVYAFTYQRDVSSLHLVTGFV